ncbi:hypothetical protein EJD97_023952, partial [Solanum chilense]
MDAVPVPMEVVRPPTGRWRRQRRSSMAAATRRWAAAVVVVNEGGLRESYLTRVLNFGIILVFLREVF